MTARPDAGLSRGLPPPRPDVVRPVPDGEQVAAIVRVALRRATRGQALAGRGGKPRGLIFLLVLYTALGLIIGMTAFSRPNVFTYGLLIWSYTFVTAGMTLVAEASTLLFDARENDILGHRPIHPRTLFMARTTSMLAFAGLVCTAINLFPAFFGLAASGARWWYPVAHLATLALLVCFSTAAVVFVYAALSRLVNRAAFDTVASWSQVAVQAVLIVSYQLVPQFMDRLENLRIATAHPALLALPPAWFSALMDLLMGGGAGARSLALAALAVAGTPLLVWGALRYLADDYARQVAALSEMPVTRRTGGRPPRRFALDRWLGPWLRDPVERGAFRLTTAYLARDRDIRMRTYPSLATVLVFAVLAIIGSDVGPRYGAFMAVLFAGTLPTTALMTFKMSPNHAAADLFRYAPIRGTAPVFHGVRKAVLVLLVVPSLAVTAAILWFGLDDHRPMLLALPAVLAVPTLSLIDGLAGDYLPLSMPPAGGRQGTINLAVVAVGLFGGGVFLGGALIAERFGHLWTMVAVELVALAIVHPLLVRFIRRRRLKREGEN